MGGRVEGSVETLFSRLSLRIESEGYGVGEERRGEERKGVEWRGKECVSSNFLEGLIQFHSYSIISDGLATVFK